MATTKVPAGDWLIDLASELRRAALLTETEQIVLSTDFTIDVANRLSAIGSNIKKGRYDYEQ